MTQFRCGVKWLQTTSRPFDTCCHVRTSRQSHQLRRLNEIKIDREHEHELLGVLKQLTALWYNHLLCMRTGS